MGKQVHNRAGVTSSEDSGYKSDQTKFLSAANLYEDIKNKLNNSWDFKVKLDLLRKEEANKLRFWNLIYYFNEYHLPYEFILPYEDK